MEITYGMDERAKPKGRIALRTTFAKTHNKNSDKMLKLKGIIKLGIYDIIVIV